MLFHRLRKTTLKAIGLFKLKRYHFKTFARALGIPVETVNGNGTLPSLTIKSNLKYQSLMSCFVFTVAPGYGREECYVNQIAATLILSLQLCFVETV